MHRLLQLNGAKFFHHSKLPFNTFYRIADPDHTCLCKPSTDKTRHRSTVANPNIHSLTKKKRRKPKKLYAEIVVELKNSLSQHKANVQRLTFNDLNLLSTTNINLSELYKLKDDSLKTQYTYSNLSDITNLPNDVILQVEITKNAKRVQSRDDPVNANAGCDITTVKKSVRYVNYVDTNEVSKEVPEEVEVESINDQMIKEVEESVEPEIESEEVSESSKPTQPDGHLSTLYKDEITSKTLASYIEVCTNLRNPQRGLNALYFHRSKANRRNEQVVGPIRSVKVYNSLLRGFAHKGNFQKVSEVLKLAEEEDVKLNSQSYIAVFECLGRVNVKDSYLKEIRIYSKEAFSRGISFDRMMNDGVFLNNERDIVLKAMKSYNPTYVPKYKEPVVQYKNSLLDKLNDSKQRTSCEMMPNNNSTGIFTPSINDYIEKQIRVEKKGYVTVKSIECKGPITNEILSYRSTLKEHYEMWETSALKAFHRDLAALSAQRNALNMEPFLRCLPVNEYITIIVEEAKKLAQGSETYSPTVHMLHRELGARVYMRYLALGKEKYGVLEKIKEIHHKYCSYYAASHSELDVLPREENFFNSRQVWQWFEHSIKNKGATLDMDHRPWVPTTLQFIGKFLYHIVMHDIKIDVNSLKNLNHKNYLPAFYTVFRNQGRITKEEVKPHPILWKLYRNSVPETLTFPTDDVPMVCPPVPWISMNTGSYLMTPSDVVRLPYHATSQKQMMRHAGAQQLYPSLDALNNLAGVAWKVNKKILDVILEVFNNGGSSSLDVPEPPSSVVPPLSPTPDMDKQMRYQLFKQRMQYRRKKAEMYSLWCDCLYRLSLANHFRDDVFWLPHNMDFRGRVYPIPPHLNHMGSDLARSMLVFAEARPLGKNGLDWLKVHLINLTGLKKRDSIAERLKFANDNIDLILDSADRPLSGKRWWSTSDEPWQSLACCMEIADALRSPDPERYRSHFPIHQDGSCNGLQHYAALGRDTGGAHSVNLTPSEKPQDVYSAVAVLVEEQRAKDAENGEKIARILEGFVKRKVIKQTVMTTVYGVTRFGARLQIAKQLKDIDDFPKEYVWQASSYLTARTFDSLRTMFTSTREIQDWFTECARLISAVGGRHVEWVTPLGLPIVQPYFKAKRLSSQVCEPFHMDKYEKPNVMKQKNAFPPNFVHSLDSSHMMLTALYCERAGITFVSVHDCYWTHPSTVNIMNKICREQFVALHSEPILENLSLFLSERFSYDEHEFAGDGSVTDMTRKKLNRVLRQLPKKGRFDISQVLDSVYFFS